MGDASESTFPQSYAIERWGGGYFGINADGHVSACGHDLFGLADELRKRGVAFPVLIRLIDVLRRRVGELCQAFDSAARELRYVGGYRAIYPIKVNQQRSVIEAILESGGDGVGLEAGSKPELMVVLALSRPGGVIVCNGYKDREYIRLALIGQSLGHPVHIVLENPSELDLVLDESENLGIEPLLGMRVRLAAVAHGKWQNSGGERSKFGLSAPQVLNVLGRLRDAGKLHCLSLLHSHIGSQIPNLRDIRRSVREVARLYAELRQLGAPIAVIDVGGGLGIDYEGTGSRHFCSMNYGIDGYAREVVHALTEICVANDLPHPCIYSESGRAITAHHAVLITEVIDREQIAGEAALPPVAADDPIVLHWLQQECANHVGRPPAEVFEEARHYFDEANELFAQGGLTLAQRACAERLYIAVAEKVRASLKPDVKRNRDLLDSLNELLGERVFLNLSIFQSMPDVWAIDQIFPIMPLHRLDEIPSRNSRLYDLTCDSDGCITQYVDQDGIESTLPLHVPVPGEPYLLGVFLLGAYQEILGDMHNLFGDTHAIDVRMTSDGYEFGKLEPGDNVDDLLRYVHLDPKVLRAKYRDKLLAQELEPAVVDHYLGELEAGLTGYTYLED